MKKILALLLTILMVISLAACADREPKPADESSASSSSQQSSKVEPENTYELPDFPDHGEDIAAMKEINDDTRGWLRIPDTTVDDVVVSKMDPNDYNRYYLRRDIHKNDGVMEGVYYADCRNQFDGTAEGLSQNTTIYGHALDMNDDPEHIRFSQLKKFWDIDFAKDHPYIYFSTEGEDLVWEIFATFFTTLNHDYINPLDGFTDEQIETFLNEIKARSEYNYNVEVTPDDKYLTLSTCVYKLTPGVYPNNYRYVIMAKLVTDDNYKEKADLEVNPNILGPDEKYTG